MIKKLRNRFIAIAMLSTAIVLLLIIGTINVINYNHVTHRINMELQSIIENGGRVSRKGGASKPGEPHGPFDVQFFSAVIDNGGNIQAVRTMDVLFLSEDEAIEIVRDVYDSSNMTQEKTRGRYNGFSYMSKRTANGTLYVFVHSDREYETFRSFLIASAGISLGGLVLVFILLCFFSKIILKPVIESYAKQKRFITDASHELKTPLTVIDANTEILEMTNGESEWTTSIRKQTGRLAKLTENLVLLSRMEEENPALELSEFNLSDTVADIAESYLAVARSKNKKLEINIAEGISYVGDEKRIGQLVGILLDNAMKYTNEAGTIRVTLQNEGSKKKLTLWNTVNDIKKGKLDNLFDRFYRVEASRNEKTGGFGIGLSVAKAIVTAHKGSIHARSQDGKTIEFEVIF